jgi:hypothetical protein
MQITKIVPTQHPSPFPCGGTEFRMTAQLANGYMLRAASCSLADFDAAVGQMDGKFDRALFLDSWHRAIL